MKLIGIASLLLLLASAALLSVDARRPKRGPPQLLNRLRRSGHHRHHHHHHSSKHSSKFECLPSIRPDAYVVFYVGQSNEHYLTVQTLPNVTRLTKTMVTNATKVSPPESARFRLCQASRGSEFDIFQSKATNSCLGVNENGSISLFKESKCGETVFLTVDKKDLDGLLDDCPHCHSLCALKGNDTWLTRTDEDRKFRGFGMTTDYANACDRLTKFQEAFSHKNTEDTCKFADALILREEIVNMAVPMGYWPKPKQN